MLRVTTRNARFQQWEALTHNRTKRQRLGAFLVQGVRPIDQAVEHGWRVQALLHPGGAVSRWARDHLSSGVAGEVVQVAPELLGELGEKDDDVPELLAVVAVPDDDLARVPASGDVVVLDRPGSPGNVGTVLRTADALGAAAVLVVGRAADLYDPKTVRASRGSLFAVPAVRVEQPVTALEHLRASGRLVLGTDEDAREALWEHDFHAATAVVVGNETSGMSAFWREACDTTVMVPMSGSASSLNAGVAASLTLYEIARQRATR